MKYDDTMIPWGPSGKVVFERTYSRPLPDGSKETWPQTCDRTVTGNLALVYGPKADWTEEVWWEHDRLMKYMVPFAILPAGRHLWASGVKGRQYLFNCHHSGWGEELSRHFSFLSLRLFEGGGVGANYSMKHIGEHRVLHELKVHVVCDSEHPDHNEMRDAGLLSNEFDADWPGSWDVEDTREGWAAATTELIESFTKDIVVHYNRVFDVSRVRRKGARLKSSGGTASGPLPLAKLLHAVGDTLNRTLAWNDGVVTGPDCMEIDHAIAAAVVAGGARRSARMSIMHWKDPYIVWFLACKEDRSQHWTTNISVEIDDEFIRALQGDIPPVQVFLDHDGNYIRDDDGTNPGSQGLVLSEVKRKHPLHEQAKSVHEAVVTGMLTNGEPGYWNSSLSNVGEPTEVTSTNPCLTGDTVIATLKGPRTFADLAEAGEDVEVYSWHPETKLPVVRWMRRPHLTNRNAEILKVTFDSGLVVRCTPDHKFYTFRGEKIEARNMKAGRSIRAFSASFDGSRHERVHGWDSKRNAAAHQYTHRMIWENANGPIPEGMVVAHLDGNAMNNVLENFAVMTPYEHASYDYPKRLLAGFDGHSPNHKVMSVESGGYADVYNGMVEDSHAYIVLDPSPIAGHMSGVVSANCGEISLVEFENCNLGHVNLDHFAPKHKGGPPDRLGLDEAHRLMTRFLIRATFGDVNDEAQADLLVKNRRIGVGHLGVQGYLAKRGIPYSDAPTTSFPVELGSLYEVVRNEARSYAFGLRIVEPVKVTTVAPTGSVAKLPGVTEGIHPVLFRHYLQGIRFNRNDPEQRAQIEEASLAGMNVEVCKYDATGSTMFVQYPTKHQLVAEVEALGYPADLVEIASEISLDDMLRFQAMYQTFYTDNACSFTANVQAEEHQQQHMTNDPFGTEPMSAPSERRLREVMDTIQAQLPYLKGTTLMLDGARPQSPYTLISEADFALYEMVAQGDGIDEQCATGACPTR